MKHTIYQKEQKISKNTDSKEEILHHSDSKDNLPEQIIKIEKDAGPAKISIFNKVNVVVTDKHTEEDDSISKCCGSFFDIFRRRG